MAEQVTLYELPFTAQPQYVSFRLAGVLYRFKLGWNTWLECWIVDVLTPSGRPIVEGIPLVMGCNLLEQFEYLGLGGQLFGLSDHGPAEVVPDFYDLGVNGHVYFFPDPPEGA